MFRRFLIPIAAALVLATPAIAQIPRGDWDVSRKGRDEQQGGQQQREVPLGNILRDIRQQYGGKLLDSERNGDRYRISWVTDDGRKLTIEADASSGRILSVR